MRSFYKTKKISVHGYKSWKEHWPRVPWNSFTKPSFRETWEHTYRMITGSLYRSRPSFITTSVTSSEVRNSCVRRKEIRKISFQKVYSSVAAKWKSLSVFTTENNTLQSLKLILATSGWEIGDSRRWVQLNKWSKFSRNTCKCLMTLMRTKGKCCPR